MYGTLSTARVLYASGLLLSSGCGYMLLYFFIMLSSGILRLWRSLSSYSVEKFAFGM